MSQFSETLTRLMRQKHLKSVELCEILSIRKSRFSKIKNGGILPTDFSLVEQLAKAMHLNPQEEKELYLSYQMSKFGHTYEQIEASMKRLYEVECPQYYQKEECLDTPVSAENGHLYTNKMAVLAAVQRLCLNTASVRIAIQPEDQDLLEILGRCVASCGDTVPMQWLFWLEPSDGGISAANLDVFSKALPVICAGRMEIRCTYGALPELLEQHLFPYFIVTERGALTISPRQCGSASRRQFLCTRSSTPFCLNAAILSVTSFSACRNFFRQSTRHEIWSTNGRERNSISSPSIPAFPAGFRSGTCRPCICQRRNPVITQIPAIPIW